MIEKHNARREEPGESKNNVEQKKERSGENKNLREKEDKRDETEPEDKGVALSVDMRDIVSQVVNVVPNGAGGKNPFPWGGLIRVGGN